MQPRPHAAEEGLLSWVERWAPADAEVWAAWRKSLSPAQRSHMLLPLQAVLAGLVAFRRLDGSPGGDSVTDFRPHLQALRASLRWALALAEGLSDVDASQVGASLQSLRRALVNAIRASERFVDLPRIDSSVFRASCDFLLSEVDHNRFFRPAEPLEFSNTTELVGAQYFPPELASWSSEVPRASALVAFLSLLRSHRYLGIADRLIVEELGLYRAQVVVAGVRQELHTVARFLRLQGIEAEDLHRAARRALADPLPGLDDPRGLALPSERLRNAIREIRTAVKEAARRVRRVALPATEVRNAAKSEPVRKNLQRDIWAFRFVVRAFVDKALAAPLGGSASDLAFASEFVRHFRVFGPRLAKGTGYARRGPLTSTVSALSNREAIDAAKLGHAAHECELFLEHLQATLDDPAGSSLASFEKKEAADELRQYLASAAERAALDHAPTGTFGSPPGRRVEAG